MAEPPKLSWRSTTIGVVDDSPDWRRTVRAMLNSLGAKAVIEAADGSALLNLAANDKVDFDILLVDDDMIPMDGFLAMKTLRSADWIPCRRATAIMMPGHGTIDIIKKAIDCGYHSVLPKPFSATQLIQHMTRVLMRPTTWQQEGDLLRPVPSTPKS